jgi:hypothetical protein
LTELAGCKNDYRVKSLVALAKHYEHAERNHARALEFTLEALKHGDGEELKRRRARLEKRLGGSSEQWSVIGGQ